MITEDYVSFETAELLKERGFDEEVLTYYVYDTESKSYEFRFDDRWDNPNNFPGDYCISAPTLQMAMKWLREKYNYNIEIDTIGQKSLNTLSWRSVIYNLENGMECYYEDNFKSYEEACEVAIEYCIQDLI